MDKQAIKRRNFTDVLSDNIAGNMRRRWSVHLLMKRPIPFPEVNLFIAWRYRFDKDEIRALLYELEERGVLEILPYNGIRLKGDDER